MMTGRIKSFFQTLMIVTVAFFAYASGKSQSLQRKFYQMAIETVSTAVCVCSMGDSNADFTVPGRSVLGESKPAAHIVDNILGVNFTVTVGTFGKCKSLLFPDTAAATAANGGVLDPQDCIPALGAPWAPGAPSVLIVGIPALNNYSTLMCSYAGTISIVSPGEATYLVP